MKFFRGLLFFVLVVFPVKSFAQQTNNDAAIQFLFSAGWLGEAGQGAGFAVEGFFPGVGAELRAGACGAEAMLFAGSEIYPSVNARIFVGGAYRFTADCLVFTGALQTWSLLARLGLEYKLFFAPEFSVFLEYGFASYWAKDGTVGSLATGLRYRF